mmetsp:Transcript_5024/g.14050  ORF Transcript_5024/g.14050 Transcript_5024/m.14050 type:complete len:434 (-) Transcript_5024:419-1720(-)
MGGRFKRDPPRTSAPVSLKASSRNSRSGVAVAKFWCLPFIGRNGSDSCDASTPAEKERESRAEIREQMAVYKLAVFCGLDNVLLPQWEEHVRGIMPETGYVVDQPALMQEYIDGVSLHALSRNENQTFLVNTLQRLRPRQVLSGVLFDMLFAKSNRPPQSILVDKQGNLRLVDNEKVLTGELTNSLFMPRTANQARAVFGRPFVSSLGVQAMEDPSPLAGMDYRCHVEGREMGRNFPGQFKTCIRRIVGSDVKTTMKEYGFQSTDTAARLKERARTLLDLGFERAAEALQPKAPSCRLYPEHEPCCEWKVASAATARAQCANEAWQPSTWKETIPCLAGAGGGRQQQGRAREFPSHKAAVKSYTEAALASGDRRAQGVKAAASGGSGRGGSGGKKAASGSSLQAAVPRVHSVTLRGGRLKASLIKGSAKGKHG